MRFLLVALLVAAAFAGPVPRTKTFNVQAAEWLSKMNAISYCPPDAIRAWQCPNCDTSFVAPSVFESVNHRAYITHNNQDTILVVFKGTDPLSIAEWLTDLNFFRDPYPPCQAAGCEVHRGFFGAMNQQREVLDAKLNSFLRLPALKNAQIVVTGHSLGGAIAQLYALHLVADLKLPVPSLFTLGAPRVGNPAYANFLTNTFASAPAFHIVSNADVVPHVPTGFMGFQHGGQVVFCVEKNCNVLPGENDGSYVHLSPLDHCKYLGLDYINYVHIALQSGCYAAGTSTAGLVANKAVAVTTARNVANTRDLPINKFKIAVAGVKAYNAFESVYEKIKADTAKALAARPELTEKAPVKTAGPAANLVKARFAQKLRH